MSIRKTIGGDRLGSGKKMKVDLKSYERSTHNTSRVFRSTMASGTLVPFLSRPILPGSTWDIKLTNLTLTHPTIGPLFGSYKVQMDVFLCPMRCYIARLHNNESGLGMDMKNVLFPQVQLSAKARNNPQTIDDNEQIEPSTILKYLGMSGLGNRVGTGVFSRLFNAIPMLAYYEIGKNYYSNQQEEVGYIVHSEIGGAWQSPMIAQNGAQTPVTMVEGYQNPNDIELVSTGTNKTTLTFTVITTEQDEINPSTIDLHLISGSQVEIIKLNELCQNITYTDEGGQFTVSATDILSEYNGWTLATWIIAKPTDYEPQLKEFPLKAIDDMKSRILKQAYTSPLIISQTAGLPYNSTLISNDTTTTALNNQQGLLVKTYQNDMFNNWMNTDWIDGENGINQITAVQIVDDKLEIPSLILARKVFNVLNRIALSGGTYDDWLEVTYDHERIRRHESPAYMGGLIKELTFEEVVSNSQAEAGGEIQPLGTLAGRGQLTDKHVGGHITIKTDEPAYVIGIVSITPRIDYSQGNEWDVNLKNMDELHKPELDAIGFQDLITDQMAWWDTQASTGGTSIFKSAGKQPAWINYQTSVNKTYGNFAKEEQMWMTLNRRYEYLKGDTIETSGIKDLTSYIDPKKFNHIFADTRRDAQNFWVQIGIDITARQKMSAKVMPNL